jgi:hypothetical protein
VLLKKLKLEDNFSHAAVEQGIAFLHRSLLGPDASLHWQPFMHKFRLLNTNRTVCCTLSMKTS